MGKVVGAELFPWQSEVYKSILNDDYKTYTVVTSRQIGKSTLLTTLILSFGLNNENEHIGVISLTFKQLRLVYNAISNLLHKTNVIKKDNKTDMVIELKNGTVIRFLSIVNYNAIRGFTFSKLLCDESAYYPDEVFNAVIIPTTLIRADKVVLFSTPKGTNFFHDYYKLGLNPESKLYKSFLYDWTHGSLFNQDEILEIKKQMNPALFSQEFECSFTADGNVFVGLNDVCILDTYDIPKNDIYFIGIDTALKGDNSAISVLDKNGKMVDLWFENTISFERLKQKIEFMLNKWRPRRCVLELNHIGSVLYEALSPRFRCLEPFTTTNTTKNEIITSLIWSVESGRIQLPSEKLEPELISEFRNFGQTLSAASKKVVFGARTGHDDIVISTALATKALLDYQSPSNRPSGIFIGKSRGW